MSISEVRFAALPPVRPEFINEHVKSGDVGEVARPLSFWEQIANITPLRRTLVLIAIAVAWQAYAMPLNDPLMLPTFSATAEAFWKATVSGELLIRTWYSVKVLIVGYAAGVGVAAVMTGFAVSTRIGNDVLATLTAMFNPLPAIAILPLALLWFGLGMPSLVFVLIHAVLWPLALATQSGFLAVSDALRMTGRNCGLRGWRYVLRILVPAAFPSILTGLKVSWAFAWRTLIAAELVFGVNSGSGGLGWFIFKNGNELETAYVFAGLSAIILIGLGVENLIFRTIEVHTVRKWGMQK